jgi:SAM-dependent methyltransferase
MSIETRAEPVTDAIDSTDRVRRGYLDLFLISFVILFFELTCIRWFGSMVVFLTFFTNIVLMACFLGMSIGCLAATRPRNYIDTVIPLMLVGVVLSCATLYAYVKFGRVIVDVGGQNSPQQIYFGTEYVARDPSQFIVPIEAVAGLCFVLVALTFVGLGQEMGRAFDAIPDRVRAYTANIAGSLVGIVAFGVASYFRSTPLVWFAVSSVVCLRFVRRWTPLQVLCQAALLVIVGLVAGYGGRFGQVIWSPYYKIVYLPHNGGIAVNNIGHQGMVPVGDTGATYALPYLLNRDAGAPPIRDVLVIGAGSGNDVRGALMNGVEHVDAVEIDPVINEIGRAAHPGRPFDDPRVTVHLDDGRSFVRRTDRKYDLIVYALVDSLVLHSGYSSLRLESFLFTEQAFRDIKAKLKPGGAFVMYNGFRQPWVVGRLAKMAETAFGDPPIVITLPYKEVIDANTTGGNHAVLFAGEPGCPRVASIRAKLAGQFFWAYQAPARNAAINGYGPKPPEVAGARPEDWIKVGAARVDTSYIDRVPTDDWPFLYLRSPTIPGVSLRSMALIGTLSLVLLAFFAPVRGTLPDGRMFFLGAGFMLLETKGVVHMALLFGSTWVVNSVVFFAILVMILLSNLFVLAARPRRLWPYYVLLIASLLVNTYVPMSYFLALPGVAKVVASCLVVFVPVFFAGVIFAASFRDTIRPDVAYGSNIAGVILGGLSENLSLSLGFDHLLLVAVGFYALSAVLVPRWRRAPVPAAA